MLYERLFSACETCIAENTNALRLDKYHIRYQSAYFSQKAGAEI